MCSHCITQTKRAGCLFIYTRALAPMPKRVKEGPLDCITAASERPDEEELCVNVFDEPSFTSRFVKLSILVKPYA